MPKIKINRSKIEQTKKRVDKWKNQFGKFIPLVNENSIQKKQKVNIYKKS